MKIEEIVYIISIFILISPSYYALFKGWKGTDFYLLEIPIYFSFALIDWKANQFLNIVTHANREKLTGQCFRMVILRFCVVGTAF